MAVETYLLIFSENEFMEFNEIANETGQATQFMRDLIPHFMIDMSKCDTEGNCYVLETPRLDYCMLLHKIKKIRPRAGILKRIYELGFTQDAEFRTYMLGLENDLRRYNLDRLH